MDYDKILEKKNFVEVDKGLLTALSHCAVRLKMEDFI